jgi:ligand-binding sensor domain-containing protein
MDYNEDNGTKPVFYQYKPDPFNEQSVSQGAIYSLVEDNNNYLWIGTENGGLNIIDLNNFNKNN